jgi:hypothetical protein
VGDAYGEEEVDYCAETDSSGFNYDRRRMPSQSFLKTKVRENSILKSSGIFLLKKSFVSSSVGALKMSLYPFSSKNSDNSNTFIILVFCSRCVD